MAEKILLLVFIVCTLYLGLATLITGKTYGEACYVNLSVDKYDVLILLILTIALYGLMWLFYKKTQNKITYLEGFPQISFNVKKIHILIMIFILVKICGTVIFSIGRVGGTVTTSLSFLFSIIKLEEFFPIYYVIARDTKKKMYWINIGLFAALQILQGWTSFIMTFAFIELFFLLKRKGNVRNIIQIIRPETLSLVAVFIGGIIYKFMWPIKQAIRYGMNVSWYQLTLNEGIIKLVERISFFPLTVLAWQNSDSIATLYRSQHSSEILCMLRPLVPSALMNNKESLRALPNLIIQSMFDDIPNNTGANYGLLMYMYTLIKSNFFDFLAYVVLFTILFILTCSLLKSFDNEEHDIKILYFLFLKSIVEVATLENVFSYSYLGAIYMIAILWVCGGIRISSLKRRAIDYGKADIIRHM